jgi:hypothetical protein
VRSKAREIVEVHRREATQQEKITTATRELAEAEAELANLGVYEPPKEEIQELGARIRELELGVADRRNQRQEREAVLSQKRARRDQCVGRFLIHTFMIVLNLDGCVKGKGWHCDLNGGQSSVLRFSWIHYLQPL